jgi:hypothetical protein
MKNLRDNIVRIFGAGLTFFLLASAAPAQQVQRTAYDVTDYKMDVQLTPEENRLNATVDVSFKPQSETRTIAFELNGSLTIESNSRLNSTLSS